MDGLRKLGLFLTLGGYSAWGCFLGRCSGPSVAGVAMAKWIRRLRKAGHIITGALRGILNAFYCMIHSCAVLDFAGTIVTWVTDT